MQSSADHVVPSWSHSQCLSEWLLADQDEATVQDLTAEDVSNNASGWLAHTCKKLFHKDMFAHIRSSDTLLRIHSTAEQFDLAAESLFGFFQVRFPACCNPLALCPCPLSLSACPLHLLCVSLCLQCPLHFPLSLRLPFAPLCLPLLLPLPQTQWCYHWCMFCYQLLQFSSHGALIQR